ncbi:MAG: PepSY-like domain-containing protein [Saprospiraceae bacterium]|uniref:PepSY-like domain-containing protein n=1 Tax=Candidatus Opimibacter skivensis TaxID=2982028 RepID=A0A9D7SVT8_9BACT|nr:PepSY-like domain-containing protein [Candidatus Opimibacter skivensis]
MARFTFVVILFCWMTTVFSQGKVMSLTPAAPDAVLKSFIKNYGDAKASWKVTEGNYEAAFKLNGMPATVWYDSTGYRMNVVVEIKVDQLPAIAKSYIERNYPKAKITKALKWTDDKKVNTFQAEIKISAESKNLLFTARGDLIKELGGE